MKNYDPCQPLLSIHIPKCGGSSLKYVLKEWFGEGLLFHYYNEKKGLMPVKHDIRKYKEQKNDIPLCIHGHFNRMRGFGVDDYYPEVKQAIIFLRDPLEIVLSVFHYNLKLEAAGESYRGGKVKSITKDIDEFLESRNSYITHFLPGGLTADTIPSYCENYFVHIGIMENYQKSLDLLADKLNKARIHIPHENISERSQRPSDSAIKSFKARNQLEYALYDYVKKLS